MRVLVTGATGFVGTHLCRELEAHGHEPIALRDPGHSFDPLSVDITDHDAVYGVVEGKRPEACVHLAGIAFVPACRDNPRLAFSVNTTGTANVLEAFRRYAPEARILSITTSEVYGRHPFTQPVTENTPLLPTSVYGISKVAADELTRHYAGAYQLPAMVARPENHMGPGQRGPFVAASFARQVAEAVRAGKTHTTLRTGNLDSERDFTDVRDTVRAYRLILEKGVPGQAYNVASGNLIRIGELLNHLSAAGAVRIDTETDPDLFRPTDRSAHFDTSRLRADTGWAPEYTVSRTMADILADFLDHPEA